MGSLFVAPASCRPIASAPHRWQEAERPLS